MTFTSTFGLVTDKDPFVANTYTSGNQITHHVAELGDGGFAVAYDNLIDFYGPTYTHLGASYELPGGVVEDMASRDDGGLWVLCRTGDSNFVRRYDADGDRVGDPITVAGGGRYHPYIDLASLAGGGFAYSYTSGNDVFLALYGADGEKLSVRQVDAAESADAPSNVCQLADGGVVVAFDTYTGSGDDLHVAVYNADGSLRVADHVAVGAGSDADYGIQSIAPLIDGGYAMLYEYHVFHEFGDDDDQFVLRTYDASGNETDSGPLIVASHDPVSDANLITLENGFLAVSWAETSNSTGARYVTVLDETGAPAAGLPSRVIMNDSDLAALGSGRFVGVGTDLTGDGSGSGVNAVVEELVRTTNGDDGGETFVGDALRDIVHGGGGNDLLITLEGKDELHGDAGQDYLSGGADADALYGGTEGDTVKGDDGDDLILGDEGNDILSGGAGKDLVFGGTEDDSVSGDDGDDYLYGEDGADALLGGAGRDTLDGGSGHDTLAGGEGDDTFLLQTVTAIDRLHSVYDDVSEAIGGGVDTVVVTSQALKFAPHGYTLADNVENGIVTGAYDFALTGNKLANALTGNAAANTLDGGKGHDTLTGGLGDDTYVLRDVTKAGLYDDVVEATGGGVDTVLVSGVDNRGYTLTANVENGTIFGNATAIQLEGNALDNILISDKGGDTLIGRAGADTLTGGKGADRFLYQDEVIGTAGGWGKDVITDFKQGEDLIVFYQTKRIDEFSDLRIANHNGHAVISTGGGETIEMLGVRAGNLTAADFQFVAPAQARPETPPLFGHWGFEQAPSLHDFALAGAMALA